MFPKVSFIVLFLLLCLSVYPIESSAFSWTKNSDRKNLSRFQAASITAPKLHEMRQRQGVDVIRIGASSSSSVSIDDGDEESPALKSSSYLSWWRKDPRNRSVSGILICTFPHSTKHDKNVWTRTQYCSTERPPLLFLFWSFFSLSLGLYDGGRTTGTCTSIYIQVLCIFVSITNTHFFLSIRRRQL